jgi:translation elongation factor EF-1alpha
MSDELVNEKLVNDVKKSKATEYKDCDICGGRYCNRTKTNHYNSDKHKKGIAISEKDKIIKEFENRVLILANNDNMARKCEELRLTHERLTAQIKEQEYKLLTTDKLEKEVIELKIKLAGIQNMAF